ncbi:MAG: hypothetical protein H6656_09210 [Ardenticatenaceae bacterium]|nr:hypothetical protein [Ardenticatenaceae bacterium]
MYQRLYQQVKQIFDPANILNPGTVVTCTNDRKLRFGKVTSDSHHAPPRF